MIVHSLKKGLSAAVSSIVPKAIETAETFDYESLLIHKDDAYISRYTDENSKRYNKRIKKYVACWNWYVMDCKKDKEIVVINFHQYMRAVPMNQVEEMLYYNKIEWK